MSTIPFFDMSRHAIPLSGELLEEVRRVLERGSFVLGEHVRAWEAEFSAAVGGVECIGVANGTDALEIALRALGCGAGDEVITAANMGMYATTAIMQVGARPVYADIHPERLSLTADSIASAVTDRTKAVIVTHSYGLLADMSRITAVAKEHGLFVVEDCAHAHGARSGGRGAGGFGDIGCYSFYPTKNLGACGDGGAVVTTSPSLAAAVRLLHQYGWEQKYDTAIPFGRNSRLDELQAAMLRVKLPYLERWNVRRRRIVAAYRERLEPAGCHFQPISDEKEYVAHLCVVRTEVRDRLQQHLHARGIGTAVHYPIPDYRQRGAILYLRGLGHETQTMLPVTDQVSAQILSLPCYPELRDEEVEEVGTQVLDFFGRRRAAHSSAVS